MKFSNLLAMFGVTVAGGVAVYAIRRKLEGNPVEFQAALAAQAERESEIYA